MKGSLHLPFAVSNNGEASCYSRRYVTKPISMLELSIYWVTSRCCYAKVPNFYWTHHLSLGLRFEIFTHLGGHSLDGYSTSNGCHLAYYYDDGAWKFNTTSCGICQYSPYTHDLWCVYGRTLGTPSSLKDALMMVIKNVKLGNWSA